MGDAERIGPSGQAAVRQKKSESREKKRKEKNVGAGRRRASGHKSSRVIRRKRVDKGGPCFLAEALGQLSLPLTLAVVAANMEAADVEYKVSEQKHTLASLPPERRQGAHRALPRPASRLTVPGPGTVPATSFPDGRGREGTAR
jgi:hypothetical protein